MNCGKSAQLSDSESWDIIKESHALSGEPDEIEQYYEKWAETYDKDVSNEQYCGPEYITDFFAEVAKEP